MPNAALLTTSLFTTLLFASTPVSAEVQLQTHKAQTVAIAQAANSARSTALVTLQDLPTGFKPLAEADFKEMSRDLTEGDYPAQGLFAFQEDKHFEYVMGFTTPLPTRLEQVAFDKEIEKSSFFDEWAKGFVEGAGDAEISEQTVLTGLEGIGDAIAGRSFVASIAGIPLRIEMVLFRRAEVGAFAWVMYIDGDQPVVPIEQVAQKMDSRLSSF